MRGFALRSKVLRPFYRNRVICTGSGTVKLQISYGLDEFVLQIMMFVIFRLAYLTSWKQM
jgi:hypothetical protein